MANAKNFLVSTADFAFYHNDILACTGTTNLNSSIDVSMDEQDVQGGKGNKLLYSFKYNRQLNVTLESADWKLEYLALNVGTPITEGLSDVYAIAECVDIVEGIGTLKNVPIGDVAVELANGTIVTVTPTGSTIDVAKYVTTSKTVNATYKFSTIAKTITIDSESTPYVGRLVLDADRHNNKIGKVGSIQIEVPSYQLSGNFTMEFTPDGVSSTNLEGKALAVEGDRCADGASVYAYVKEFDKTASAIVVNEIVATPATISLDSQDIATTATISVVGLKGTMYSNIELDNANCTFVSDAAEYATVDEAGVVTAVATGTANITVKYGDLEDTVTVTVA